MSEVSAGRLYVIGRRILSTVGLVLLSLATGCSQESIEGDTRIFTFAPETTLLLLILSAATLCLIWWLCTKPTALALRLAGILLVVGLTGFVIGGLLKQRIMLSTAEFTVHSGNLLTTQKYTISFAELRLIEIVTRRRNSGRISSKKDYMWCHLRSHTVIEVPVQSLAKCGALQKILEVASQQGIKIVDKRS